MMELLKSNIFYCLMVSYLIFNVQLAEAGNNTVKGAVRIASDNPTEQKPLSEVKVQITCPKYTDNAITRTDGRYTFSIPTEYATLEVSYKREGYIGYFRDEFRNDLFEKELDTVALTPIKQDGNYKPRQLVSMGQSVFRILLSNTPIEKNKDIYMQLVSEMNKAGYTEKAAAFSTTPNIFSYINQRKKSGDLCVRDSRGDCLFPQGFGP